MVQIIKLAVCDLAGTTMQDTGQVPAAFRTALDTCNLALSAADLPAWWQATWTER